MNKKAGRANAGIFKGPSMIIKARQKALPGDVVILQPVTLILLAKETREGGQRPKIPGVLVRDGVVAITTVWQPL